MKQYRKYFQDYYGIKLNKNYDIHHIDLNHENNQISNLMILPKKLHNKYHILINSTNFTGDIFFTFNMISLFNFLNPVGSFILWLKPYIIIPNLTPVSNGSFS